uniref:Protein unc-93 homolog A n=2 Tax=Ciona savignyi TaxID=51511 RepID=H2ZFG5_CIOSA
MTPICFYYGFLISYSLTDFTRAFVSCTLGVEQVGLILIVYGALNTIAGFGVGKLVQHTGLPILYMVGGLFDVTNFVLQLLFRPTASSRYWVYAFSAMLGTSDGVWQTTIAITMANLFEDRRETAFAAISLWSVFAMMIGFVMSGRVCLKIRLISLIVLVILGCLGYGVTERKRRRREKNHLPEEERIIAN